MIDAAEFVDNARRRGFRWYAGVPCSYLTPFINYVIDGDGLTYLSSANEGDAVATAAGIALGGGRAVAMMQNSGLGNAINPLTSLVQIFELPVLIICTQRGAPGIPDEPQHALMGRITEALFDTMDIPWRRFPIEEGAVDAVLDEADEYLQAQSRPFALIMQKGSVSARPLNKESIPARTDACQCCINDFKQTPAARPTRRQALQHIQHGTPLNASIVIATTGYTGRELYALADRPNQLYMVGSMGCASSLGLGISLVCPQRGTVVVDGDGAALMRLGNFATIGSYAGDNFTHIVLDNEAHDSTGAQATVTCNVAFAEVAAACGYASVISGDTLELIDEVVAGSKLPGPRLLHIKTRPGTIDDLPRPTITPKQVARRLSRHLQ